MEDHVTFGHLTKYDASRMNRDQVMDFEIWFKIHTNVSTMEPRFNEVAGDRPNLLVKWRVRYIEDLDITNLGETTKMFVKSRS